MPISRRDLLKVGSTSAAAAVAASVVPAAPARADVGRTTLPYPRVRIAKLKKLGVGDEIDFAYPDEASPCLLTRVGRPVRGGIGPEGDVVAYSRLCPHMGCVLDFDDDERVLRCICHYSTFDAEQRGQMVCGQATRDLARVVLEIDDGHVVAVGVEGLLYGRQSNLL